ncbi:glycerophosphodiester phosphodiesterase family protein [Rapidithrix thailandica]|uniref:Glycerophosphodiester phosphodiesterase family protein n=1 Tax=Rapidithrix thailandica TaxID=413964 RepID=A0AAW9S3Z4_9BACT
MPSPWGVDIVELDVRLTKDKVPVILHDGTIDRTTNGSGKIKDLTWKELQKLSLTDKQNQVTPYKVPSLQQALEQAKGKILIDLDLKVNSVDEIIAVIEQCKAEDQVFFFDSDYAILKAIQKQKPEWMLMPRCYSSKHTIKALKLFTPQIIHIDKGFYTAEVVQKIKDGKARVWMNALGDTDAEIRKGNAQKALDELLHFGANIIQTDEPELLLKALRKRKLHW